MLSLTQTRSNLLPLFNLMIRTNMEHEVVYKGKVYIMTVRATDLEPKLARPKRKEIPIMRHITTETCSECGSLMFEHICMNTHCIHAKGNLLEAIDESSANLKTDQ